MTRTDIVAIVAAAVSFGSMVAAIVSAWIAGKAKDQARQAALLEPRTKVINHLLEAVSKIQISRSVTSSSLVSLRAAQDGGRVVFSDKVGDLDRAIQTANHLIEEQVRDKERGQQDAQTVNSLVQKLKRLMEQMETDAALR
jgi:hypothetical protein